jgi:hypothetical protein
MLWWNYKVESDIYKVKRKVKVEINKVGVQLKLIRKI